MCPLRVILCVTDSGACRVVYLAAGDALLFNSSGHLKSLTVDRQLNLHVTLHWTIILLATEPYQHLSGLWRLVAWGIPVMKV